MAENKDLMQNKQFVQEAIHASSETELLEVLKEYGVDIDSEKLQEVLQSHSPEEVQLTVDQLEQVAGGSWLGDFWQGFKYGFTDPAGALGFLISKI